MPREPEVEQPATSDAKDPGATWRILILDRAEAVELLKGACKQGGYDVVGATTIDEAWAFLDGEDHADVIVCAAHLPEESMFAFLRAVRDHALHRRSKFLILSFDPSSRSARLDTSTKRAGMAMGADGYLVMRAFDACELFAELEKLRPAVPLLQQSKEGGATSVRRGSDRRRSTP